LEATGTWVDKDKIIEIAMIRLSPSGQETTYCRRVNPAIPIPPIVSELTGIRDKDIEDAPKFADLVDEILAFIADCDLCGFNAERYDLPLLEREIKECGKTFNWQNRHVIDVQKIYHLNEKRDLTAAYKFYCQKELDGAHSAMVDTRATLEILAQQVVRYGKNDGVDELKKFEYKTLADFYDVDRKFRWWNGDLYMMFGKYAKRFTLQEIAKKDRAYLEWILSADFSEEVKSLVSDALNGRFPDYKQSKQGELFEEIGDD
jgi:DNA polymerase-3 subunit epsilon